MIASKIGLRKSELNNERECYVVYITNDLIDFIARFIKCDSFQDFFALWRISSLIHMEINLNCKRDVQSNIFGRFPLLFFSPIANAFVMLFRLRVEFDRTLVWMIDQCREQQPMNIHYIDHPVGWFSIRPMSYACQSYFIRVYRDMAKARIERVFIWKRSS